MAQKETATFALGCFWGHEARFGSLPGLLRTRVGYAGGTSESPTYYEIGDHAECVEMDFDPEQISFSQLLSRFWDWHNATRKPYARQYMSAVLYHNEAQKEAVDVDLARFRAKRQRNYTQVLPYQELFRAEEYHQKYYLRREPKVVFAIKAIYPEHNDFNDSYAAMRLNSLLSGYLSPEGEVLADLGLPEDLIETLLKPNLSRWQRVVGKLSRPKDM